MNRWRHRAGTDVPQLPAAPRTPYRAASVKRPGLPLEEELSGKRILFSDKTSEQAATSTIIAGYRSQESGGGGFRQMMKDPKVVSFSPMFHFAKGKIRVYVLYCVLTLVAAPS